jgi:hypothetical protein
MRLFSVCFLVFVAAVTPARASEIPTSTALRILIGEASGEGERGMQAVAEVLRRRNSTRGFYGIRARHVDKQPAYVWARARRAWKNSRTSNITRDADHFEGTAFKIPKWARGKIPVAVIGKQRFYKIKG